MFIVWQSCIFVICLTILKSNVNIMLISCVPYKNSNLHPKDPLKDGVVNVHGYMMNAQRMSHKTFMFRIIHCCT